MKIEKQTKTQTKFKSKDLTIKYVISLLRDLPQEMVIKDFYFKADGHCIYDTETLHKKFGEF